jgi:hypothetical protein
MKWMGGLRQLVTAIHDEGDSLRLCQCHSQLITLWLYSFLFVWAWRELREQAFKVLSIVFSGYTAGTGYDFQWLQQMYCIQVVTSCAVKGYVQGAAGCNHYPLYRPLYALGLDACMYRGKLIWNKTYCWLFLSACLLNAIDIVIGAQDTRFWLLFAWNSEQIPTHLSTPAVGSLLSLIHNRP